MVTRDTPRLREIKQFLIDFFWKTYYARFGSANPSLRPPDHPLIPASVHYVNYVIVEFCGCKILIVFIPERTREVTLPCSYRSTCLYLGNSLVCYVYLKTSSLRTPSNRLLLSLTLSDLLMMSKSWILIVNAWENGPVLGILGR